MIPEQALNHWGLLLGQRILMLSASLCHVIGATALLD